MVKVFAVYAAGLLVWWLAFVLATGGESPVGAVAFVLLNVAFGFAVGRFWVILVALEIVVVGAFVDEPYSEDTSGSEFMNFIAFITAGMLALGAAARWLIRVSRTPLPKGDVIFIPGQEQDGSEHPASIPPPRRPPS